MGLKSGSWMDLYALCNYEEENIILAVDFIECTISMMSKVIKATQKNLSKDYFGDTC
jgi:hypothetical protein